ncbi:11465_t:CDS:1, partial [Funneliformis geosporum]
LYKSLTHSISVFIKVIDLVVQGQSPEICKIPGVLWPAIYGIKKLL